jgi:hypothetical protein
MHGEYRWVTYTVTPTDDGFYIHGDEIDVAGPFNSEAAAHAGARKIIDESLAESREDPPGIWLTTLYGAAVGVCFYVLGLFITGG